MMKNSVYFNGVALETSSLNQIRIHPFLQTYVQQKNTQKNSQQWLTVRCLLLRKKHICGKATSQEIIFIVTILQK